MSKEKPEIEIGDYTLSHYHNGDFWLAHKSGEGMQVNKYVLAKLMHEFYKENF